MLLVCGGHDSRTTMETLGHSQISLTMTTYAHVASELQREAASKMDSMLQMVP
jgi:integrase